MLIKTLFIAQDEEPEVAAAWGCRGQAGHHEEHRRLLLDTRCPSYSQSAGSAILANIYLYQRLFGLSSGS